MRFAVYHGRKYQQCTAVSLKKIKTTGKKYQNHAFHISIRKHPYHTNTEYTNYPQVLFHYARKKFMFRRPTSLLPNTMSLLPRDLTEKIKHLNCSPCYFSRVELSVADYFAHFEFFKRMIAMTMHIIR